MDNQVTDTGAAWMAHAKLGQDHELLAAFAGNWHHANEIWPAPGVPMQRFDARSEMTLIYDGRYLQQTMSGGMEMEGMTIAFHGTGHYGFDNFKRKHFFAWIDNSTTVLMLGEGEADASGKITYHGELPDPFSGTQVAFKAVLWKEGPDKFIFDNFARLPDGSWFLKMRMTYTRV
jgi:hypothetical protein